MENEAIRFVFESTRHQKRVHSKSLPGRGLKTAMWISSLYENLREEFKKLRAVEVKFFCTLVQDFAEDLVAKAANGFPYYRAVAHNCRPIVDLIIPRCVYRFLSANRIVLRAKTGKLIKRAYMHLYIEKSIVYNLEQQKKLFSTMTLTETVSKMQKKTQFLFNMANCKTLELIGYSQVSTSVWF